MPHRARRAKPRGRADPRPRGGGQAPTSASPGAPPPWPGALWPGSGAEATPIARARRAPPRSARAARDEDEAERSPCARRGLLGHGDEACHLGAKHLDGSDPGTTRRTMFEVSARRYERHIFQLARQRTPVDDEADDRRHARDTAEGTTTGGRRPALAGERHRDHDDRPITREAGAAESAPDQGLGAVFTESIALGWCQAHRGRPTLRPRIAEVKAQRGPCFRGRLAGWPQLGNMRTWPFCMLALRTGTQLDRYRLDALVGSGGMGGSTRWDTRCTSRGAQGAGLRRGPSDAIYTAQRRARRGASATLCRGDLRRRRGGGARLHVMELVHGTPCASSSGTVRSSRRCACAGWPRSPRPRAAHALGIVHRE